MCFVQDEPIGTFYGDQLKIRYPEMIGNENTMVDEISDYDPRMW